MGSQSTVQLMNLKIYGIKFLVGAGGAVLVIVASRVRHWYVLNRAHEWGLPTSASASR